MSIISSKATIFCQKRELYSLIPALILLLILIVYTFIHIDTILWDFEKDYTAARLYRNGHNPYDNNILSHSRIPHFKPGLEYVYPLATTFIFVPFTYLDYFQASSIWLFLTLLIISMLVLMWRQLLNVNIFNGLFPVFAFLMFNMALPKSVLTGNINTLETMLIWLGLVALIKGRTKMFSVLIGMAAVFKLTPLVLVGIMLIHKDTRRWHHVVIAILMVGTVLVGSFLLAPSWFNAYQENLAHVVDIMGYPTLYSIVYCMFMKTGFPGMQQYIYVLIGYGAVCALLGWFAFSAFRHLSDNPWSDTGITIVMYACLTYALVLPRFADYNYLLIIPAAWYGLKISLHKKLTPVWLGMFILPSFFVSISREGGDLDFGWWALWNLFMLIVAWGHFTHAILNKRPVH